MADPAAAAAAAAAPTEVGAPASPPAEEADAAAEAVPEAKRWPGWPGDNVFRMVVPVLKVGSIIGRKGELIKRLVEETKARVRVLEGPVGATERIVLVSGKEDPGLELPPAMDALIRVFKRVNGITDGAAEGATQTATAPGVCAARLLVPGAQAINLIGKQGASIKAIQEGTGATIRVISVDERDRPFYVTDDERIVEIQGETEKVLKAVQAVSNHLRKFLVDHSVLPLFEKTNAPVSQDRSADTWSDMPHHSIVSAQVNHQPEVRDEYALPMKREHLYLEREPLVEHNIHRSGVSLYGRDPALSALRPSGMHGAGPLLTQITQTMQIPLTYAEDIIGVKGANIAYIRANSGAVVTIQESMGSPDDITVEIKGTSSQVQAAQQLIQDSLAAHREPVRSSYAGLDPLYRSSYTQYGSSTYQSSSLPSYSSMDGSGYSSSGLGGYGSTYRY
ncbi:hypothetical protein QYE76_012680 [Lolium multiflorum]|uniref:K Homology domain-containing protein n=1 Tax=Lolium multiflorum TaxID=4521 RepID=A0AAD8U1H9_LOLMU|nr:hypothetical protein QYE76_012680 [Lolium multiflorum]